MAAAATCTAVLASVGSKAAAQDRFTDDETARLAAGELVKRPLHVRRGRLDLIGGSSWQVLDAPPEVVWRALHDVARYPKMLPGVRQAKVVAGQGQELYIHLRQGAWPVLTSYCVILRDDPAAREIRFELDRNRPHELNAGWGFVRLVAHPGNKTLLAFGMLADVGHGLLAAVGSPVLQSWMLKVPSTVKRFLESGGRNLYGRAAAAP